MSDWLDDPGPPPTGGGEEYLSDPGLGDPYPAATAPAAPLDDHLWVFAGGSIWDLGPPSDDADADGVAESLTRGAAGGVTVYSDRDLDGRVDRITELDAAGEYRVSDLDPDTGDWHPGALGRLD